MSKRAICEHCERPQKTCLCSVMIDIEAPLNVLILQDKKEAQHALSSAPLIEKSISNCQRVVGEVFDPLALLGKDWQQTSVLLFPSESAQTASPASCIDMKTLIVLDGTWKKVARLMHLNPWLAEIRHIKIPAQNESQYRIRKSPRTDGLSSIEATVAVLNSITESDRFNAILPAFEKMIDFQIQAMGEDVYLRNYKQE